MDRSEIEQAVTALLEQEWSVGDEVRFTDPSAGITAPRVGTVVGVQPTTVEVNIGDRVVSVPKSQLTGSEPALDPAAVPVPAFDYPEPELAPEPTFDEPAARGQFPGQRDFRDNRVRRASEMLGGIRMDVDELLSEIGAHRDAGNWDLEVVDLQDYRARIRAIDGMIGRLLQP